MEDNLRRTMLAHKYCSYCGSTVSIKIPDGDNKERAVCDKCGSIFYENPKIVSGCLLTYDNKILLCERATEPRAGYWTLPAGFLENNETIEGGAARETFEEARAKAVDLKPFLLCNLPHISQLYIIFYGELLNGEYSAGPESSDVKLFSQKEIPWNNLAFPVIEKTISLYYEDKKNDTIAIHFETITKKT